ncbi:NUDIX domain-containing protein [Paenisporosarcina cavernae]|uniref:NUDIX hydrolase n=1 Tax=Paenisporosarcina cavernae TaxID=2320858 RepID=A0A385YPX6_9BACL|nr:NUDIX hydrolase [Paenisporosarcina cavernae]AYC28785.1 NUDIX hydrolase [Paenisporosarcina cavernae]
MKTWCGSAAICLNKNNEILMVKGYDTEHWSIPSGEIENGESAEECCLREVKEETGYDVKILERLWVKETVIKNFDVKVQYFKVEKIGRSTGINDPDGLIEEIAWKSISELEKFTHLYPEDVENILEMMK